MSKGTNLSSCLLPLLVLATSSLAAGCSDDLSVPIAAKASITWEGCGGIFECGTLKAPLRYDEPNAEGGFDVSVIRRLAVDPSMRIGSLLVNPGGPGGSGVDWVRVAAVALP